MDLLQLLGPILIAGGAGGSAGHNGHGGHGGPGGRGGSSYSWTDHTYETCRDANGHTYTKTHTHYRSNPGGFPGPSGSSGRDGAAHTHCGRDGADGTYEFIVEHVNGPVKYFDKYNLKILDFTYMFIEDDGVIEPGEKGLITSLTIQNTGLMPSPI